MIKLILLIVLAFCASCVCKAQSAIAEGTVNDLATKLPLPGVKVFLQINVKRTGPDAANFTSDSVEYAIDSMVTDSSGKYFFTNIMAGNYSLRCAKKMPSPSRFWSTSLFESLELFREETSPYVFIAKADKYKYDFTMMITCPYDKTKDQFYCPRCKKEDMVLPIFWGLPVYNRDGKYVNDELNKRKHYFGGCEPDFWCNPSRHCERCDLSF